MNVCVSSLVAMLLLLWPISLTAGRVSDPAVDSYNLRFGSRVFGANYPLTTNFLLLEGAVAVSIGSVLRIEPAASEQILNQAQKGVSVLTAIRK